jgi:hypothetical protein
MSRSAWSRVLVFLTLLGALFTLASWLGAPARLVLFLIVAFFVVQAIPVYLILLVSLAYHRRRALESIERLGGRIASRLAADPGRILELDLSQLDLTDLEWDSLHALLHVESLNLSGSSITDAQMESISRLPALRNLDLDRTAITDAGLASLPSCPRLQFISLTETEVTEDGLEDLLSAMPNLHGEAEHLPRLDLSHFTPFTEVAPDASL